MTPLDTVEGAAEGSPYVEPRPADPQPTRRPRRTAGTGTAADDDGDGDQKMGEVSVRMRRTQNLATYVRTLALFLAC
jgi:hypothetical protein